MKNIKEITLEITKNCHLNCIYCSTKSTNFLEKKELKYKELQPILQELSKYFNTINISGGEPFNHNEIDLILINCRNNFEKINIYTSGTHKTGNHIKGYSIKSLPIEKISKYNINNLTLYINFQTAKPKIYEKLYGIDSSNMKKVVETFDKCKKYNIDFGIHILPNKINIESIDYLIDKFLKKRDINKIKFLRLIPHGMARFNKEILKLDTEDYKKLNKFKKYKNIKFGNHFSINGSTCRYFLKCMIDTNLKMYPCTAFKHTDTYINLKEKNIKYVIENKLLDKIYKKFLKTTEKKCLSCSKNCNEVCPIQILECDRYISTKKLKNEE